MEQNRQGSIKDSLNLKLHITFQRPETKPNKIYSRDGKSGMQRAEERK
jgi:hypothetical protein